MAEVDPKQKDAPAEAESEADDDSSITESDVDHAIKSWDELVPDFAGMLNAGVINEDEEDDDADSQ